MRASLSMAALLLLLCSMGLCAQQGIGAAKKGAGDSAKATRKTHLKPATVSGYVFAITKAGDVKPARMAKVYMLYSRGLGESADALVDKSNDQKSAADVLAAEIIKGLEEARAWQQDKPYLQDSTVCNSALVRGYHGAIVRTMRWGEDHKSQFIFADADEEGRFEITVPPHLADVSFEPGVPREHVFVPGVYLVAVYGEAGYNNAFWEAEVKVEPGTAVQIKLPTPTKACLKMDSDE